METLKQAKIKTIKNQIHNLGLSLLDTDKLAKRIGEGQKNRNQEEYAQILFQSCETDNLMIRFAGKDLVVYSETGYAVIDPLLGEVELCYLYEGVESFESKTAMFC
jgi:hypothetical protein